MQASKKSEFLALYQEFSEDYPLTEKGKEHVSAYSKHRQQGQQNYREVEAVAARGEDITDLVLLKWIPYSDTPANREREVWIHHAPCVTGDLVKKSENNGNTVDWAEQQRQFFSSLSTVMTIPLIWKQLVKTMKHRHTQKAFRQVT